MRSLTWGCGVVAVGFFSGDIGEFLCDVLSIPALDVRFIGSLVEFEPLSANPSLARVLVEEYPYCFRFRSAVVSCPSPCSRQGLRDRSATSFRSPQAWAQPREE